MDEVMKKAEELAQAILASDLYNRMRDLEEEVQADPEAAGALQDMVEKRKRVEDLLSSRNMDRDALKEASREMQDAEKTMNANGKIQTLKAARKAFSAMMNDVNRVLRMVITGEVEENDFSAAGCSGDCSGCSGCS